MFSDLPPDDLDAIAEGCLLRNLVRRETLFREGIQRAVAALPGASNVEVAVVFAPPWSPTMLSESARRQLGEIA